MALNLAALWVCKRAVEMVDDREDAKGVLTVDATVV